VGPRAPFSPPMPETSSPSTSSWSPPSPSTCSSSSTFCSCGPTCTSSGAATGRGRRRRGRADGDRIRGAALAPAISLRPPDRRRSDAAVGLPAAVRSLRGPAADPRRGDRTPCECGRSSRRWGWRPSRRRGGPPPPPDPRAIAPPTSRGRPPGGHPPVCPSGLSVGFRASSPDLPPPLPDPPAPLVRACRGDVADAASEGGGDTETWLGSRTFGPVASLTGVPLPGSVDRRDRPNHRYLNRAPREERA
jgi:hypothetical protein